jgi:ketosteroid isomerase-like protein
MTATSANVDAVRRFYTAIAERDLAAVETCFAPNALWHLPGTSLIAGDHRGWTQIRDDFLARLGPLSGRSHTGPGDAGRVLGRRLTAGGTTR